MFRKLVSNLPFSPALVHDVGFYAKRLRKEEITRRTAVLFVVLTMAMQSLAVFSPPESANASSEQDIVRGGVSSLDEYLLRYDRNDDDLKDILTAVGITRSDLSSLKPATITSHADSYMLTRYGYLGASDTEKSLSYTRSVGGVGMRYFSPLSQMSQQSVSFSGWAGTSPSVGWFGIIKSNGSLATRGLPDAVNAIGSDGASAHKSISGKNLTQGGADTAATQAQALDRIAYTIRVANTSSKVVTAPLSVKLSDVLEYATLIDGGGGSFETATGTLSWPQASVPPGAVQERTFVVQLFSRLPATPKGQSNPASYDCTLAVAYGTQVQTAVACPPAKTAETILGLLPSGGMTTNVLFAVVTLATVGYFYARTRQLKNEIRIIRHDVNTGII